MRTPNEKSDLDLTAIRARLAESNGSDYWRSLEEAAGTEEFQSYLHREFPEQADDMSDPATRRKFLQVMGASLALAGVSGCAIRTPEKIVPWVKSPENVVPGRPQFFASAMSMNGLATGILVESHSGRPTKIEGNPDHPASLGSTDIFMQAATLGMYDPDRSKVVLHEGAEVGTWDDFLVSLTNTMDRLRKDKSKSSGLRFLTGAIGSPSLGGQIQEVLAAFPGSKWHRHEPVTKDSSKAGAKLAFGEVVDPVYHFDKADIIVSLDADFLACGSPGRVCDERAFAAQRDPSDGKMNRLYVAEGAYTNTGAAADHRLPIRPGHIVELALAIAKEAGVEGAAESAGLSDKQKKWAAAVAKDLKANKGKGLVLVGESQPAYVHALAHAMNGVLGNIGPDATVHYIDPIEVDPVDNASSFAELVKDMVAGKVETLVILGGNPVYDSPSDIDFAAALDAVTKIGTTIRLGLYDDETSEHCTWHIPEAHFLESWGDARAFDGTATIVQPMIAPLYDGKTASEVVAAMMGQFDRSTLKVVQEYWKAQKKDVDFNVFWRTSLNTGKVEGSASKPKTVTAKPASGYGEKPAPATGDFELVIRPDPTIWDGRFANNGWLQELPKPITKLTWDNAALVSFAVAEKMHLKNGQVLELKYQGRTLRVPLWIVPGQAEGTVVLHLGYGRTRAGQIGTGPGFDAYALQVAAAPYGGPGLQVKATDDTYRLATTQMERNIEGRDHVRVATLGKYLEDKGWVHKESDGRPKVEPTKDETLAHIWEYDSYAWGMAIDLNSCTGCNACVVSCVAENNIAVIGKEQIEAGRSMQWIEIDTYFHAPGKDMDASDTYFQPRTCMHCENAPCELVCPVGATLHDAEGLNVMVYNRCVGTRYCGNNCPYKVRHFNFLDYSDLVTPSLKLLNNPDVTVRSRGVMEKCTYCVQRISGARINAKEKNERIKDGDVVTACQAACPAQAIHFGDINDKNSKVSKIKAEQRNYKMLDELNTKPRTSYLGKVRNPNPELTEA